MTMPTPDELLVLARQKLITRSWSPLLTGTDLKEIEREECVSLVRYLLAELRVKCARSGETFPNKLHWDYVMKKLAQKHMAERRAEIECQAVMTVTILIGSGDLEDVGDHCLTLPASKQERHLSGSSKRPHFTD